MKPFFTFLLAVVLGVLGRNVLAQDLTQKVVSPKVAENLKLESSKNRLSSNNFQKIWNDIKLCRIQFYLPSGEEGIPFSYLHAKGYQVIDSGDGYLQVQNVNERFYGYKVLALTLPGEWKLYDLKIKTTADYAYKNIFMSKRLRPYIKAKDGFRFDGNDDGIRYIANWDSQDQYGNFHALLTIADTRTSNNESASTISCSLEYGN